MNIQCKALAWTLGRHFEEQAVGFFTRLLKLKVSRSHFVSDAQTRQHDQEDEGKKGDEEKKHVKASDDFQLYEALLLLKGLNILGKS